MPSRKDAMTIYALYRGLPLPVDDEHRWSSEDYTGLLINNGGKIRPSRDAVMRTKPYKLLIGPDRKEFEMPEGVISILSPRLHRIMSHSMQGEPTDGIPMPDIDEEMFSIFHCFATHRWYPAVPRDFEPEQSFTRQPLTLAKKAKIPQVRAFRDSFNIVAGRCGAYEMAAGSRRRFSDPCLRHIKTWIFADYQGIPSLQAYSLTRLVQNLFYWPLNPNDIVGDLRHLVEFVGQKNLLWRSDVGMALAAFAACIMIHYGRLVGWAGLMRVNADFRKNVKYWRRIRLQRRSLAS